MRFRVLLQPVAFFGGQIRTARLPKQRQQLNMGALIVPCKLGRFLEMRDSLRVLLGLQGKLPGREFQCRVIPQSQRRFVRRDCLGSLTLGLINFAERRFQRGLLQRGRIGLERLLVGRLRGQKLRLGLSGITGLLGLRESPVPGQRRVFDVNLCAGFQARHQRLILVLRLLLLD